jgi:hypothetical protein
MKTNTMKTTIKIAAYACVAAAGVGLSTQSASAWQSPNPNCLIISQASNSGDQAVDCAFGGSHGISSGRAHLLKNIYGNDVLGAQHISGPAGVDAFVSKPNSFVHLIIARDFGQDDGSTTTTYPTTTIYNKVCCVADNGD